MRKLFTIQSKGENYTSDVIENDDGSVQFNGDMDIDIDGAPDWKRDPFGQPDTALHYNGLPINAQIVPFIVVPPEIIQAVKGIVLGCKASVRYGIKISDAVVADIGPHKKLGEGSPALARNLGINDDPNHGGIDDHVVLYRLWPGVPAVIDGIEYNLQPHKG